MSFCMPHRRPRPAVQRLPQIFTVVLMTVFTTIAVADSSEYEETIKPLLAEKCTACHGTLKQESGLRLDAAQFIRTGGDTGPAIASGDASASLLFERVTTADSSLRMPPIGEGEALDKNHLAELREWINSGAVLPEKESVPDKPEDHWAYQSPVRPTVPASDSVEHPIDALLNAAHRQAGVVSVEPADKATLLRRVYLDLTGLPPGRSELQSYLADDSPAAYSKLVDRLLASPEHGERWARHWMDVWRYSDWDGYKQQLRGSQRHIWRWRDWIVESLNADKGYDQMIVEMLAGDEIAPKDNDVLRATGFLARNYHKSNRDIWLDATVEHTAKAFLGLTINCARCHDHKYDPIAQRDYFRMRAIFEPHAVRIERLPGNANLTDQGLVRAFDAKPDTPTYLYVAGNEKQPDKDHPLSAGIPQLFGELKSPSSVSLPVEAWLPSMRRFVKREEIAAKLAIVEKRRAELSRLIDAVGQKNIEKSAHAPLSLPLAQSRLAAAEASLNSLEARWAADEAKYVAESEESETLGKEAARLERWSNLRAAEAEFLAKQGAVLTARKIDDKAKRETSLATAKKERDEAESKLHNNREKLPATDTTYKPVGSQYPRTSTGRRLSLARWITSPQNPLTARVAVNHIWLRHFGQPLVGNVFDFGLRSPQPKHVKLLDWLACELVDHDWSMQHLHRLIVTSNAFKRASSERGEQYAISRKLDPDNQLFWRANVRRLEAEVVRDSVLAVSGSLDRTIGGPDIAHAEGENIPRRSIYFQHAYEKQMRMLVLFDAANPTDCYRRVESIVPQQALALANSRLSIVESRKLAHAQNGVAGSDNEFVTIVFEKILTRPPSNEEHASCIRFLSSQASLLKAPKNLSTFETNSKTKTPPSDDPHLRARENLVHVLLNHNDFVSVR